MEKVNKPGKNMVYIIPNLTLGGAQRQLIIFANVMSAAGWKIDILIFTNMLDLSDELIPEIKIHLIKGSTLNNPLVWYRARKLLSKIRPEVVVGWGGVNLLALVTRMPWDDWRIVICERIYLPGLIRDIFSSYFKRKIVLILLKHFYRRADIVTANSVVSLRFLRSFIGKGPAYIHMPNIIDTTISRSIKGHVLSDISHFSHNSPRILALGRLEYQKGFDILLDAMAIVIQKRDWKLVVVGDGSEREKLKLRAGELGIKDSIFWLGAKPNPFPYYKWADIVVVPSRYEGFPNVPLEAMASGCKVICTDCMTGPRELIKNGRVGILVPTDNPEAMADSIIRLGDNPEACRTLGKEAFMHVKSNYDIQTVAPLYKSMIDQLHARI